MTEPVPDDFWFVRSIPFATYLGSNAGRPDRAEPVDVACWFEEVSEVVTDAEGKTVTASGKVYAPLSMVDVCNLGAQAATPTGTKPKVVKRAVHDSGALGLGLDHIELWLA